MSSISTTEVSHVPVAGDKVAATSAATETRGPGLPLAPILLGLIMLGGLLLRLLFWSASSETLGWPLVLDEGNYVGIAEPMARGEGIVDKWAWMRPPGYPAYIALFLLLGFNLASAALIQIILSIANIGMVYLLAVEVFANHAGVEKGRARAAGLFAAGLLALNPQAAFYADLLMPETPYMLAVTVMAWALLRAVRLWRPSGPVSGQSLLLLGLAALMASVAVYLRSALQTFVPLALGWLLWVLPRRVRDVSAGQALGTKGVRFTTRLVSALRSRLSWRALVAPALFLAVMIVLISPWTLRNYLTYDRFMLMDAVGGLNLWQYNGDLSRGEVLGRLLEIPNPVDRDRYATEQGVQAILANPARFAGDAARRFTDSWPVEYYGELWVGLRNKLPGIDCTWLDLFSWASTLFYVSFGLLVIVGVALAPGRVFKGLFLLFLLHYAATTIVAHNEFRYRLPLYPYASVFGGWALLVVAGRVRAWRGASREPGERRHIPKVQLVLAGVLAALFVVQCAAVALPGLAKSVRFERRYLEGKSQLSGGDYESALASFRGAAEIDKGCSCLYRNIALAHGGLGQPDEERAALLTALEREEYDWRSAALLSDRLRSVGSPRAPDPIRATRPEYRTAQQNWAWENLAAPLPNQLDVGGADIGFVRGWHAIETEGDITYRWSTERASAQLGVPAGTGRFRLLIYAHSLAWPGKADPNAVVRVLADGRDVGTFVAGPGWGWFELELGDLGVFAEDSKVVIELQTATARPPGDEIRSLGVAVDRIRLERANP